MDQNITEIRNIVSILVLVDIALEVSDHNVISRGAGVSILVLVDIALEAWIS